MSIKGFIVNGQALKYNYPDLDNIPTTPTGGGVSEELKQALLQLAEKVAYIDDDGQDYYDDLYDALYPVGTYTVTNTLVGCANSNTATSVSVGGAYTGTLTASDGYSMTGATVVITMEGVNITGTSYLNGTISIPNVTGNIVITATATSLVLSSIDAVFAQGQAVIYDTDSLDTLKQYLVVTATYSDSSTSVVPSTSYTLSGTLSIGTSTITVSYEGKTDTFSVTVTADPIPSGYTKYDFVYNNQASSADHLLNTYISGTYCGSGYEHELTFAVTNSPKDTSYPMYGVRSTSGSDPTSRAIWSKTDTNGNFGVNYNGVDSGFVFNMQINTKYKMVTASGQWKMNDVVIMSNMGDGTYTPYTNGNIQLWGIQTGTNARGGYTRHTMKIYGFKVKDISTGDYIADMVPCKDSNNVAGLYDIVRQEFYKANTPSTLTAGND